MAKPSLSFNTVTIENIGGYFESHTISFPRSRQRNILLVHGENTSGKTSLLNALKWCLFNHISASASRGGSVDPYGMYNRKAIRSGAEYPMRVIIEAEYDQRPLTIERKAEWRFKGTAPTRYEDLDITFTVTRYDDNHRPIVMNEDDSERYISQIAPAVLGRFFLFDGELLDEYHSLVSQSAHNSPELKKAIDGVLGLPVLDKASLVLRKAIQTAEKKTQTLARGGDAEQLAALMGARQSERQHLDDEIEETNDQLEAVGEQLSKAQAEVDKYASSAEGIQQKTALEKQLGEVEQEIRDVYEVLCRAGKNAWHDLAIPALKTHQASIQERSDALHREGQKTLKRDHLEELRQTLMTQDGCPVCLQSINDDTRASIKGILDSIDADREAERRKADDLDDLVTQRRQVERLVGKLTPVKDGYEVRAERLATLMFQQQRLNEEIDEAKAKANSVDKETIEQARRELMNQSHEHGCLTSTRATQIARYRQLDSSIEDLQSQIEKATEQDGEARKIKRVRERLVRMAKVIDAAKDRQAEAMRQKVEEYTSQAYRAMTHERHHKAVRITPNTFGMTIIDDEGNPVWSPAAGATQILALSLIISLGQIGRKIGPLVMDTPLGRLDPKHRRNVLEYLPLHTHQVAMLYHAGEIDNATYKGIQRQGLIGKEYAIEKGEGEDSSRLVEKSRNVTGDSHD